jgi:hypothetical protein
MPVYDRKRQWKNKDSTDRKNESEDRAVDIMDKSKELTDTLRTRLLEEFSIPNGLTDEERKKG